MYLKMYLKNDRVYLPDGRKATVVQTLRGPAREVETTLGTFREADLFRAGDETSTVAVKTSQQPPRKALPKWEEVEAFEDLVEKIPFDCNGHFKGGTGTEYIKSYMMDAFISTYVHLVPYDDIKMLLDGSCPPDHWIRIDWSKSRSVCPNCDMSYLDMETNGTVLKVRMPCPHPEGRPPFRWTLNVPSGRLVVANDLRDLFPVPQDRQSVNEYKGCEDKTSAYAAVGMAHASVGNSCPGVYHLKEGRYEIAQYGWDEETDEELIPDDAIKIASICTDLWWYSICDHAEYLRRCSYLNKVGSDVNVVDVEPGLYEFTHYYTDRSHPSPVVYSSFERIGPPLPEGDLFKSWREYRTTPTQYAASRMRLRPHLYGGGDWAILTPENKAEVMATVVGYMFFTSGKSEWHEGGFPVGTLNDVVIEEPTPSLRKQQYWPELHKDHSFEQARKNLSPEFADLALRSLESLVSFGKYVSVCEKVRRARKDMQIGLKLLRELSAKYPAQANPDYVWWINEGKRADDWVKRFPIGPDKKVDQDTDDLDDDL